MKGRERIHIKSLKSYTISKSPYSQGLAPSNILHTQYSRIDVANYLRGKREWAAKYEDTFFTKIKPGVFEQIDESNPLSDGILYITEEKEYDEFDVPEEYWNEEE